MSDSRHAIARLVVAGLVAATLVLLLAACDGVGRAIVGDKSIPDGGDDERCEVTPACREVRTVDPISFVIAPARRQPPVHDDCDADRVPDAEDNCPGVPNPDQNARQCQHARATCTRLRNGAADLVGADLRGCRIDEPIAAPDDLSLQGANLNCAHLTLTYGGESAETSVLDASGSKLASAAIHLESPGRAVVFDVSRSTLDRTFLRVTGGARIRAHGSILDNASLVIEPGGSTIDPSPALEIANSAVDNCSIYEEPAPWPGRIRVERSAVTATTFQVGVLDLVRVTATASHFGAQELLALSTQLTRAAVSTGYGAFAACHLRDVVFARCEDLHLIDGLVEDIDVPSCAPDRFRIEGAEVVGARIGGGLWLVEGALASSVVGAGPSSVLHTTEAELDAVTICDLGAGAFEGGELRCVKCQEDAFMNGTSVCVSGARIIERGCPAIELAPVCP